jgi:hypothetical protein
LPAVIVRFDQPRESRPAGPVVLDELVDMQPLCEHGGDDLAERVIPFVRAGVPQSSLSIGVGRIVVIARGL